MKSTSKDILEAVIKLEESGMLSRIEKRIRS
jgi:hypothetical protein